MDATILEKHASDIFNEIVKNAEDKKNEKGQDSLFQEIYNRLDYNNALSYGDSGSYFDNSRKEKYEAYKKVKEFEESGKQLNKKYQKLKPSKRGFPEEELAYEAMLGLEKSLNEYKKSEGNESSFSKVAKYAKLVKDSEIGKRLFYNNKETLFGDINALPKEKKEKIKAVMQGRISYDE